MSDEQKHTNAENTSNQENKDNPDLIISSGINNTKQNAKPSFNKHSKIIHILGGILWGVISIGIYSSYSTPFLSFLLRSFLSLPFLISVYSAYGLVYINLLFTSSPLDHRSVQDRMGDPIGIGFVGIIIAPFLGIVLFYIFQKIIKFFTKRYSPKVLFASILVLICLSYLLDFVIKQPVHQRIKTELAHAIVPNANNLIEEGIVDEGCTYAQPFPTCMMLGFALYKGSLDNIKLTQQTMDSLEQNVGGDCHFYTTDPAYLTLYHTRRVTAFQVIQNNAPFINYCKNYTTHLLVELKGTIDYGTIPTEEEVVTKAKQTLGDNEFIYGVFMR